VLKKRIIDRRERRDDWKLSNWGEFLEREPIRFAVPFPHIEIDTEHDAIENMRTSVRYILS
jgi:hypothetical protein